MFSQDSFEGEGYLFASYNDEDVNVTSLVPMDAVQSGISMRQVPNVALGEAALVVRAHRMKIAQRTLKSIANLVKLSIKRSAIFVASCTIPPTFTPSLPRIAKVSNSEIASSTHSGRSPASVFTIDGVLAATTLTRSKTTSMVLKLGAICVIVTIKRCGSRA